MSDDELYETLEEISKSLRAIALLLYVQHNHRELTNIERETIEDTVIRAPRRKSWHCEWCGRTIYDFNDHLPRCPALGRGLRGRLRMSDVRR